MVNEQSSSYFQLLIHKSNLQSCLCQYVKELFPDEKGEMRDMITLTQNSIHNGTVENIGVEPMTSCMPCKRSSQLS